LRTEVQVPRSAWMRESGKQLLCRVSKKWTRHSREAAGEIYKKIREVKVPKEHTYFAW